MSSAPTLELCDAAVRRTGFGLGPSLSLRSEAHFIGLIGDWDLFLSVIGGQAEIATGSARVLGCELEWALARGVLGFAACDPPLPASLTALQYLRQAARLRHGGSSRAAADAKRALDRYGLNELGPRRLAELAPFQRRAVGVALGTLTEAAVVCLEAPLRDLDAPSAEYVTRLCVEAARHARIIVTARKPPLATPERTLLDSCDELFLLEDGVIALHGAPSQVLLASGTYLIRVSGADIPGFCEALRRSGCELTAARRTSDFTARLPPEGSSDLLLDAALDHGLVVLSLEPL